MIRSSRFVSPARAMLSIGLAAVFASGAAAQAASNAVTASPLTATAKVVSGHVSGVVVRDASTRKEIRFPEAFTIVFADGSRVDASKLDAAPLSAGPGVEDPHQAFRVAKTGPPADERCWAFSVPGKSLNVKWCLIARPGTHYVRELLRLDATGSDAPIAEVRLLDFADKTATVDGKLKSSPIVDGTMFFGFEHPLSVSTVADGNARASLFRTLPLKAGQGITYSAVIGTAPDGQLRRGFLDYLERERPRPYSAFLHYNSWYDIGYTNRFSEADVLDRIHAFGEELTKKRHVKMDSFLLDDGWDNTHDLWKFNPDFPNGLDASSKAAAKYGFGIGLWFSPWGGYGDEKLQRVAYGHEHGYEILKEGYALSGPKYYQRFENTCLDMVRKYNVNQFKFDGTGNADRVFPGSTFDSDFDAAIHLIEDLRRAKPDVFINLTTGTTASPFWVFYADSIWRGGEDHDFSGVGTPRQRWMTYRDAQTYKNIVQQGPLFPLNSLMLHGIIYAKRAKDLGTDPKDDFADEVHSYFGSGTQTQELYITPGLLSKANWDTLAEAARWSREHREVLKDTHWIGGDPDKLEVYGWGAWSEKLGVITLRNPSDREQTFHIDAKTAFELSGSAVQSYQLQGIWKAGSLDGKRLQISTPLEIHLAPFQVFTVEAVPAK